MFIATACPPVKYKSLYGLNLPDSKDYVSHEKSDEEIRNQVSRCVPCPSVGGCGLRRLPVRWWPRERLQVLPLHEYVVCDCCDPLGDVVIERFETSVFDGKYVTDEDN